MNGMHIPLNYDLHVADYQRRVEENLRLYRLFHAEQPHSDVHVSARWPARWGLSGAALQFFWVLAYGFARYKA